MTRRHSGMINIRAPLSKAKRMGFLPGEPGKARRGAKRGGRNRAGVRLLPHKYRTTVRKRR